MATDPSIILQGAQPPPQPFTLNSIAQLEQMRADIMQRKQQQATQNSLAQIYANPQSLGPDGMPNAQAIQQIGRISPQAAMQLTTQRAALDEKRALTQKNQMDAQQQAQTSIQKLVRDPAINAYDQAISEGKTPQQAQQIAQGIYSEGIDSLFTGGYLSDDMKARVPQNFDPVRVRANSLSYKDVASLREKKLSDERADKRMEIQNEHSDRQFAVSEARLGLAEKASERAAANAAGTPGGMLDDDTKQIMAQQYLAGDKSVMSNLGRGRQGAENIVALRKEIVRQAKDAGMSGAEIASKIAEFGGLMSGERTLGTRTANVGMAVNEASQFADLALKASNDMPRGQFTPVNKALQAFDAKTGDTKIRAFGAYNNSLINAYARAISPSGTPTVSDKDHAREMLSTADSPEQYAAVVGAMKAEMEAASASPGTVRDEFREAVTKDSKGSEKTKTVHWDDL